MFSPKFENFMSLENIFDLSYLIFLYPNLIYRLVCVCFLLLCLVLQQNRYRILFFFWTIGTRSFFHRVWFKVSIYNILIFIVLLFNICFILSSYLEVLLIDMYIIINLHLMKFIILFSSNSYVFIMAFLYQNGLILQRFIMKILICRILFANKTSFLS